MRARLATEDAVFVLYRQDVHLVHVQTIRGAAIRGEVAFANFEPDTRRVPAAAVIHRDDESVRAGQLLQQRISQMRRERGDAALARQVIPERRKSPDRIGACQAFS